MKKMYRFRKNIEENMMKIMVVGGIFLVLRTVVKGRAKAPVDITAIVKQ